QHTPARHVHRVDAAQAGFDIQSWSILPEARNDARSADEGDILAETQAARPAGQLDDRLEAAVANETQLAVTAVFHPYAALVQPGGVRPGQPTSDGLARRTAEDDAATVHWKVLVAGPPLGQVIERRRVPRRVRAWTAGDGV